MSRKRLPPQPGVRVGQVWRDNDPRPERWVRVVDVQMRADPTKSRVLIVRCEEDGTAILAAHTNWTGLRRFTGRVDGFSIHTDVGDAL